MFGYTFSFCSLVPEWLDACMWLQSDNLVTEQRKQEAHSAALKAGRAVVEDLKEVAAAVMAKDAAASAVAQRDCELEYLSVAAHHLKFQRKQMQMLLKRAEYCVTAIQSEGFCCSGCSCPEQCGPFLMLISFSSSGLLFCCLYNYTVVLLLLMSLNILFQVMAIFSALTMCT